MPRPKPADPLIEEFSDEKGRVFVIHAFKDGGYSIELKGKTVAAQASQLGAYFGAPQWPSIKIQAEAMTTAKRRAARLPDGAL
jgi:hypothetical protein